MHLKNKLNENDILLVDKYEFEQIKNDETLTKKYIKSLAEAIIYHREKYYQGNPEISDEDFDTLLFDRLQSLSPKHKVLKTTGTKPKEKSHWKKAKHEMKMFSLTKMHTRKDLDKLSLKNKSEENVIEDKLDGFSIEVIYDKGKLQAGITRGDGFVGEDITRNVEKMQGIMKEINFKERVSFRGEILLFHEEFAKLNEIKKANGEPLLVNPRNAVSLCKRLEGENVEYLKVVFYDAEAQGLQFNYETEKLKWIESLGFNVVRYQKVKNNDEAEKYFKNIYKNRLFLNYDIDGQVVKLNNIRKSNIIDEGETIPKSQKAWKFPNTMILCQIVKDIWSIKTGSRITPVGAIKALYVVPDKEAIKKLEDLYKQNKTDSATFEKLGLVKITNSEHMRKLIGANIGKATLNNIHWIKHELNKEVGPQDFVIVERSNDVIPKIVYVVHKSGKKFNFPKTCPKCNQPTELGERFLTCSNSECSAKKIGILASWIDSLEIRDISLETLEKFYELELVTEPAHFYQITVDDIASIEGMGVGSGSKLLKQLNENKKITLLQLISGLGIDNVGSKTTEKIIDELGISTIEEVRNLKANDISKIYGLGDKVAEQFLNGIAHRREIIDELLEEIDLIIPEKTELESNKFKGLSFCITGTLSKPRKEFEAYVISNGGKLSGVNKKLDYLVLGENAGSKLTKAQTLGINIISEQELMELKS